MLFVVTALCSICFLIAFKLKGTKMNKIFLVSGIVLGCFSQGVLAQVDNQSEVSEIMIGSQKFLVGPAGVDMLKSAVTNPDGTRTIKKGTIPSEINDLNKKFCEARGGKDITNDGDTIIGSGTKYVVICTSTNPQGMKKPPTGAIIPVWTETGRVLLPVLPPESNDQNEPQKDSIPQKNSGLLIKPYAVNNQGLLG